MIAVVSGWHYFAGLPYPQIVSGEAKRQKRVMVFCNTLDSCRATEHFLAEAGLPTLSYHGALVILQSSRCTQGDAWPFVLR